MTAWRTVPMGDGYEQRNGIFVLPEQEMPESQRHPEDDVYRYQMSYLNSVQPFAEVPRWNLGEDVITLSATDYAWKD